MTTSIVECPHCHYRFNYEFIPGASFTSIRLGPVRILKCPHCKELHNFKISHFGSDPSMPTHGDNSETSIGGKVLGLLLGPLIILVTAGILLLVIFHNYILFVVPFIIGFVWIVLYIIYLYRNASVSKNRKLTETK